MIERVLVVCEGNVCRSPMAAALLARALESVIVESAGINALIGHEADATAVSLMDERGLDIRAHRARQLVTWITETANLVLVMDQHQKRFIERRFVAMHGRIYRLGDSTTNPMRADEGFDIPDPYRKGRAAFEESLSLIEAGVNKWSARIAGVLS